MNPLDLSMDELKREHVRYWAVKTRGNFKAMAAGLGRTHERVYGMVKELGLQTFVIDCRSLPAQATALVEDPALPAQLGGGVRMQPGEAAPTDGVLLSVMDAAEGEDVDLDVSAPGTTARNVGGVAPELPAGGATFGMKRVQ